MAYQVSWAPRAIRDLQGELEFLTPASGKRLVKRVHAAIRRLQDHPEIGAVAREDNHYRELVMRPFRIFYRVASEEQRIYVVRLWDNRRNPDDLIVEG